MAAAASIAVATTAMATTGVASTAVGQAVADVRRDGERLVFSGGLLRGDVAALWPRALPLVEGVRCLDVTAVPRLDSAGLALLAELAARAGGAVRIDGTPAGLLELQAAYRLSPELAYAA